MSQQNEGAATPTVTAINPYATTESDAVEVARIAAKWKPLVLALIIVALLLRVLAAVLVERHVQNAGRAFLIEGDANGYWELAEKIASGQDYAIHQPPRHVLRTPGLPLVLAASIRSFGNSVLPARFVLAVFGAACCWLTYCLGAQLHMRRTGFWAALFVAVNPLHIGNSVLILSETLFTFWMLLSLVALVWLVDGSNVKCAAPPETNVPCSWRLWLRSVLTGVLIGIAVLVRPGFLPWLVAASGLTMFFMRRAVPIRLLAVSGLIAGCVLALLPWAARNASVTGHWVVTSLWSGPSLYDGLHPGADGSSNMEFFDIENVMLNRQMSEFEMNEHYKHRAVEFAKENPGRALQLAAVKMGHYLSPAPNIAWKSGWLVGTGCVVFWAVFLGLAIFGVAARKCDAFGLSVLTGPFLLFLLVHMVFVGSVRYRLPVEFPLSVLAAMGWRSLVLARGQK